MLKSRKNSSRNKYEAKKETQRNKSPKSLLDDPVPTQTDMNTPTQPVFNSLSTPDYDSEAIFNEMDSELSLGTNTNAINLALEAAPAAQQEKSKAAGAELNESPAEKDNKHEPNNAPKKRIRASRRRFEISPSSAPSAPTGLPSTASSSTHTNMDQRNHTLFKNLPRTLMNSFSVKSGNTSGKSQTKTSLSS